MKKKYRRYVQTFNPNIVRLLYGPGSTSGGGGGADFLHFFGSRLVLGSTQPPIKLVPGIPLRIKAAERRTSHPSSS